MKKQDSSSKEVAIVYNVVIFVCVAIAVVCGIYAYYFPHPISTDSEEWARYGEYLGGTIGPISGFATIVILWRTLRIQQRDSRDAVEQANDQILAMRLQGFEQTLFSWIALHRDIVGAIKSSPDFDDEETLTGLHALDRWYQTHFSDTDVRFAVNRQLSADGESTLVLHSPRYVDLPDEYKTFLENHLIQTWLDLYSQTTFQLDSYFRTIYRLFKWIDSQPESLLSFTQKFEYAALVRAQLSWVELMFLFMNGMTDRGHQFIKYYDKYSVFDNFDIQDTPVLEFMRSMAPYADSAYNSDQARTIPKLVAAKQVTGPTRVGAQVN